MWRPKFCVSSTQTRPCQECNEISAHSLYVNDRRSRRAKPKGYSSRDYIGQCRRSRAIYLRRSRRKTTVSQRTYARKPCSSRVVRRAVCAVPTVRLNTSSLYFCVGWVVKLVFLLFVFIDPNYIYVGEVHNKRLISGSDVVHRWYSDPVFKHQKWKFRKLLWAIFEVG